MTRKRTETASAPTGRQLLDLQARVRELASPGATRAATPEERRAFVVRLARDRGLSRPLIEYLQDGEDVTPEIRQILTDQLDGRLKLKPRRVTWSDWATSVHTRGLVKAWQTVIEEAAGDPVKFIAMNFLLRSLDYPRPFPEGKRAIAGASRFLAAAAARLTPAQLDERRFPRARRKKSA